MIDEQAEAAERFNRVGAALCGKAVRGVETNAKTGENFFVEDRGWNARRSCIDDEPNRVRPDIDDR